MENKLTQKYGLFTAIAMVIGIVIGSGVFFKGQNILKATGGDLGTGILAWIIVVVAVVLIVLAVLQLLSALNIVKIPAIIDTVAKYALVALAVVSILALIANIGIRAEFIDYYEDNKAPAAIIKDLKESLKIGASLWIVAITNAIAAVCGNLFAKKAK